MIRAPCTAVSFYEQFYLFDGPVRRASSDIIKEEGNAAQWVNIVPLCLRLIQLPSAESHA